MWEDYSAFDEYDNDVDFDMSEGNECPELPDDAEPDVDYMQEQNDFAHDDYPYVEDQYLDGMYEE